MLRTTLAQSAFARSSSGHIWLSFSLLEEHDTHARSSFFRCMRFGVCVRASTAKCCVVCAVNFHMFGAPCAMICCALLLAFSAGWLAAAAMARRNDPSTKHSQTQSTHKHKHSLTHTAQLRWCGWCWFDDDDDADDDDDDCEKQLRRQRWRVVVDDYRISIEYSHFYIFEPPYDEDWRADDDNDGAMIYIYISVCVCIINGPQNT